MVFVYLAGIMVSVLAKKLNYLKNCDLFPSMGVNLQNILQSLSFLQIFNPFDYQCDSVYSTTICVMVQSQTLGKLFGLYI